MSVQLRGRILVGSPGGGSCRGLGHPCSRSVGAGSAFRKTGGRSLPAGSEDTPLTPGTLPGCVPGTSLRSYGRGQGTAERVTFIQKSLLLLTGALVSIVRI